ncbi:hypothetical protein BDV11DRAFT_100845 [Aspergillus similis]
MTGRLHLDKPLTLILCVSPLRLIASSLLSCALSVLFVVSVFNFPLGHYHKVIIEERLATSSITLRCVWLGDHWNSTVVRLFFTWPPSNDHTNFYKPGSISIKTPSGDSRRDTCSLRSVSHSRRASVVRLPSRDGD